MKQVFCSIFILLFGIVEAHASSENSFYLKVKAAYDELVASPSETTEVNFFRAFPENYREFVIWEQQFNDSGDQRPINMYIERLGKLTAINDSVYCRKLINLAIGANYEADGLSSLQTLLREKVNDPKLFGIFIDLLSPPHTKTKGEQLRFWMFYWSSLSFIEEGYVPKKKNEERRPELNLVLKRLGHNKTMRKIVRLAYEYSAYQVFFTSSYTLNGSFEQDITKLYQQYLSDKTSLQELDSLAKSFLTDEMYDRLHRASSFVDYDILTRSQDGSEMASQTVSCRHLGGEWYEVSWKFNASDSMTYVPLRVSCDKLSHKVRIGYVVPEWGGREYGDDLLKYPSGQVRDDVDALTFVKSFYESYIGLYVSMHSSLSDELEKMRREYCTKDVLRMFGQVKENMASDGVYKFDLLIGNTDFDVFKSRSLRFQELDDHTIMLSYDDTQIQVSVQKQNGKYRFTKVVCLTGKAGE